MGGISNIDLEAAVRTPVPLASGLEPLRESAFSASNLNPESSVAASAALRALYQSLSRDSMIAGTAAAASGTAAKRLLRRCSRH